MARIKTYSDDTVVVANDKWIGSDSQGNWATKNYTAQSVANFINQKGNQLQSLRYTYKNTPPRSPGTISFDPQKANNVPFSDITSWILSNSKSTGSEDISSYYTAPLIGSQVLVTQCADIAQWAIYEWDSSTPVVGENFFSNIGLSYKQGNGGLINDEDYFISLLKYDVAGDSDKNYVFNQAVAASTWVVQHNLNKFPSCTMVLSTGQQGYGDVTFIDTNNLTITFASAESGKAYIN